MAELIRTGIFYDGSFFARVSDHYRYHHERAARISITGLHEFIRDEVANHEHTDARFCNIVEAHYFRSRFPAEAAERHDALLRERRFEDVLIRAGVTPHFLLMPPAQPGDGDNAAVPTREKGIDVWLALEAYELALRKQLNVVVLVTGDGDFLQLVRKLSAIGTRIMLTAWDLQDVASGQRTRTSQVLLDAVTYPVAMHTIIDDRARRTDPLIDNLFVLPNQPNSLQESAVGHDGPETHAESRIRDDKRRFSDTSSAGVDSYAHSNSAAGFGMGVVENLVVDKGYGFIRPAVGGDNLFFHASDVEGGAFSELQSNDDVRFVVASNPRDGRLNARRVSRVPSGDDL
ncbi:MAG: NYN domain-containing protein [Gammaproteobacteria bacterium]|nr:NYN domain-containing protein [Gammaproteobacteria bacterium]